MIILIVWILCSFHIIIFLPIAMLTQQTFLYGKESFLRIKKIFLSIPTLYAA